MAYTITASVGTVAGNDLTYNATAHSIGGFIYLTYTKGDETSTQIGISYQRKKPNDTGYYSHVTSYAGTLQATSYSLTDTGNYRIPYTFGQNEAYMKLTFSNTGGTPTGTLAVDIADGD